MENGLGVRWALFDLIGAVLDPSGIAEPLGGSDADRRLVAEAFHEALLLTMADTLSGGGYRPLPEYLRATLERALRAEGRDGEVLDAAMRRAAALRSFPEAAAALSRLRVAGVRLGVLTNSTTEAAERALAATALLTVSRWLSDDQVQTFKPDPRVYTHAVERVATVPAEIVLVAGHGWDVMGAMRAGLRGAWVARSERWLVPIVPEPDVRGEDLDDVAGGIVRRGPTG